MGEAALLVWSSASPRGLGGGGGKSWAACKAALWRACKALEPLDLAAVPMALLFVEAVSVRANPVGFALVPTVEADNTDRAGKARPLVSGPDSASLNTPAYLN